MALDRFVRWRDKTPTRSEVMDALRGFIGEAGTIREDGQFVFVTLPGKPSDAFREAARDDERWFEVFFEDDHIDVMTRMQDRFTNAVAQEFAKLCAQYWGAEYDDGH